MRTAYRVLAYLICALVAVQAAMHAWASAGLTSYIFGGGVIDMNSEAPPPVPEFAGIIVHGMNGMYVIPLVTLSLLVVSFFTKNRRAVIFAAVLLVLVVLQVTLGLLGHGITFLALLHGLNALAIFGTAITAGRLIGRAPQTSAPTAQPMAHAV